MKKPTSTSRDNTTSANRRKTRNRSRRSSCSYALLKVPVLVEVKSRIIQQIFPVIGLKRATAEPTRTSTFATSKPKTKRTPRGRASRSRDDQSSDRGIVVFGPQRT